MKTRTITLCGSARFEGWFHAWNEALSLAGHAVFGLAVYPSQKADGKNWYTDQQKELLDRAHLAKIAASDTVFVLNVYAYIGESTLKEVEYARSLGKDLVFLESWGKGCGICDMHNERYRQSAWRLGVPHRASPIDTTNSAVYPYDLLGTQQPLRTELVKFLCDKTDEVRCIST